MPNSSFQAKRHEQEESLEIKQKDTNGEERKTVTKEDGSKKGEKRKEGTCITFSLKKTRSIPRPRGNMLYIH